MSKRAVFLDRDGVINRYVYDAEFGTVDSPATPEQFVLLAGAGEAIAEFNQMGFLVVVVSNQPGVAKGRFSRHLLDATTQKMKDAVGECGGHIDAVYYCLHHPSASDSTHAASCDCRKPAPGMFLQAAREWDIDLPKSYTIGDGVGDILAGSAARTTTIFLSPRKSYIFHELADRGVKPQYQVESLLDAVPIVKRLGDCDTPRNTFSKSGKEMGGEQYARQYLDESIAVLQKLDIESIEQVAQLLATVRDRGGRLFLLGVGGGAGHASHAVCDFRKICGIEAYSASDNVSELTARVNDDGWETSYANWLRGCRLTSADGVMVFSVGGGDVERNVSANLVHALQYAQSVDAAICGVVGRDGGYTARVADACVLVRVPNPATVTAHTESFQALVWHLLVSHPRLKASEMKWESTQAASAVLGDLRAS